MSDTLTTPIVKKTGLNPLVEILLTVAVPALILSKLSGDQALGPVRAFMLALAFPLGVALVKFAQERRLSLFAALGLINVLLTGSLGLLQARGVWFAVKEASVPMLLGMAVLWSQRTEKPLVRSLLYNDKVLNIETVNDALTKHSAHSAFDDLLASTAKLLAASFFLSAALNFGLTSVLLTSPSGTEAFNAELGKITALSYPVIVLPCMVVTLFAFWRLSSGIKKLTGLDLENILKSR